MLEFGPQEVANVKVQGLLNHRAPLIFGIEDWHECELCWLAREDLPPASVFCNCHGHRPHDSSPTNTTTLSIHSS